MLRGQISNRQAPSILVRVDNFLVVPKNTTLKDRLANRILGENTVVELDNHIVNLIRTSFRSTDYRIGLVVLEEAWNKYSKKIQQEIINLPIGDIHIISSVKGIPPMLYSGEYVYHIDNEKTLSVIGHPSCVTSKEFYHLIIGGYTFE